MRPSGAGARDDAADVVDGCCLRPGPVHGLRFARLAAVARDALGGAHAAVVPAAHCTRSGRCRRCRPLGALAEEVLSGGAAVVIPDLAGRDGLPEASALDPYRYFAGAPLTVDGTDVGALIVLDTRPRRADAPGHGLLSGMGRLTEQDLRRGAELRSAELLQRRLRPRHEAVSDRFEVAVATSEARWVSGDLHDWFVTDGVLRLVVGDLMGKGLGPAILAGEVRGAFRAACPGSTLSDAVARTAQAARPSLEAAESFLSLFAAQIDLDSGMIEFVDAGHGLALVATAEGTSRDLVDSQPPLGVWPDHRWTSRTERVRPGERLLVATDGVLDLYGSWREVCEAVTHPSRHVVSAGALVGALVDGAPFAPRTDDVTVFAVNHRPRRGDVWTNDDWGSPEQWERSHSWRARST